MKWVDSKRLMARFVKCAAERERDILAPGNMLPDKLGFW